MNPIHTRLLSQQLVAPKLHTAAEVVRYMGAMQAQDYRMMRLAVKMRTCKPEKSLFEEAFNEGEIVRMHLLRMTWQLVPRELTQPLVHLCHDRNLRSLRGWTASFGFNPTDETLQRTFLLLTDWLQGGKSLTNADLCERLQKAGLAATRQQARYLLHYAEIEGVVCNGELSNKDITYALFAEKVGTQGFANFQLAADQLLAALARAYFRRIGQNGVRFKECMLQ